MGSKGDLRAWRSRPLELILMRNYPGKIHLLGTDVVMPHMQGPELAKQVAALHSQIRVLYMSRYAPPALDAEAVVVA